jgi:hypothetical protein
MLPHEDRSLQPAWGLPGSAFPESRIVDGEQREESSPQFSMDAPDALA